MDQAMPDVLARICSDMMREVAERRVAYPIETLRRKITDAGSPRGFANALKEAVASGRCGLIAEVKKASPSAGLIRPDFDPAAIAQAYEHAGATCLSVLTNAPYFQGEIAHLKTARAATRLPVLRKDFMVDPWQIYESRAMGADCVLIIMAAVTNAMAIEMEGIARSLEMDVLVEVHDQAELDRALGLQTPLIGVNNRNLKTMRTDLQTTIDLAPFVPPDRLLITESGIRDHHDVHRLGEVGAQCLLVGESLLRQADIGQAVHALLGTCAAQ
ncbi:indole-3-glycerol phosphate synthase TrpC [Acidisphaera sp. L21]|jgi:indole-3-glycerol phosphate synthase|uniref:indole-3-glycerol phosphate synthase TrpC n=1 Tax=Acidisphaera sp. L21 TaxID=1641851 RepID=UPI00131CAC1F|nr:indole-3-glycerol phosphate synthase TrpC [Acidisphaera sp. L21]